MLRRILSFALFAIVALVVLKIALGLLGLVIGLGVTILFLAALGYGFYFLLRVFSPDTALKVRDMIKGRPTNVP